MLWCSLRVERYLKKKQTTATHNNMNQNLRNIMLNGMSKSQKTLDKDGAIMEKSQGEATGS